MGEAQEIRDLLVKYHNKNPDLQRWLDYLAGPSEADRQRFIAESNERERQRSREVVRDGPSGPERC